jgi:hypothetical protein
MHQSRIEVWELYVVLHPSLYFERRREGAEVWSTKYYVNLNCRWCRFLVSVWLLCFAAGPACMDRH